LVIAAVTSWPDTSTLTVVITEPGLTEMTVPASWLRVDNRTGCLLGVRRADSQARMATARIVSQFLVPGQ
jgi:hypothetical protein